MNSRTPDGMWGAKPASPSRVHAIVVTYQPERGSLSELLKAVAPQVERVIVVDNASRADVRSWLGDALSSEANDLIFLDQNVGVAAAHNLGIARARERGADAVLLLDQDSLPAPDMVNALRSALRSLTDAGEAIAAVGPTHVDRDTGVPSPFLRFGIPFNQHLYCRDVEGRTLIQCEHLITSGTLIPTTALDVIGGMDEALFVDNVDTEWCFRALSKGFRLYGVCQAEMAHSLGEGRAKTWLPFSSGVVAHPPIRLYYIVRNHVLLYKRGYTPAKWTLQDLPRLLFKVAMFCTAIPPRSNNLSMMAKGFRDGIADRTGAYASD